MTAVPAVGVNRPEERGKMRLGNLKAYKLSMQKVHVDAKYIRVHVYTHVQVDVSCMCKVILTMYQ